MRAWKSLRMGCEGYQAYVIETKEREIRIENIPVVKAFPDVFPKDLPGFPPEREVDFERNLLPGAAPISKAPYRMAPLELQELKKEFQELLDMKYK